MLRALRSTSNIIPAAVPHPHKLFLRRQRRRPGNHLVSPKLRDPRKQTMQGMPEQCRTMMQNMPQGCMGMMQQMMQAG